MSESPILKETRKALIWNAVREAFQFQFGGKEDIGKKEDRLRVAAVLGKVLKSQADDQVKERAKQWIARMVHDPRVRRMFRESDNAGIESFLLMDEEQQNAFYESVPAPAVHQIYQWYQEHLNETAVQGRLPKTSAKIHEFGEWGRQQLAKHQEEKRRLHEWGRIKKTEYEHVRYLFTGKLYTEEELLRGRARREAIKRAIWRALIRYLRRLTGRSDQDRGKSTSLENLPNRLPTKPV